MPKMAINKTPQTISGAKSVTEKIEIPYVFRIKKMHIRLNVIPKTNLDIVDAFKENPIFRPYFFHL